jgi:hypothetical protein
MPCANPSCSKEIQSLIEQLAATTTQRRLEKSKRRLRRTCHAQPPQDIHEHMVKKIEKDETEACTRFHIKRVPKATREVNNKNKEKGEKSNIDVVCINDVSMSSKSKRWRGKRRCFKCKELGHFIALCLHMENKDLTSPKMTLTKTKNEKKTSYQVE